MASSDDGMMLDKKKAPSAWKQLPAAATVEEDLGEEEWPLLPAAAAKKAPSSSAAPVALKIEIPCKETLGASSSRHGDRATPVPDRRAAVPSSSSSSSPMHAPNNHMNGAAFRGRQNGRPQGRGGGGYNRRPVGGGNGNGRGDTNVRVPHGRGRPNGRGHGPVRHRPSGLPMHSQPPPFMAMPPPPMMPYFDPYMGYEFAYGFPFTLLLENGLPFTPYPLPMYPQHGAAAVHQHVDAPPPLTAEELQQAIRTQIEYYFSATNLVQDIYLRQQMDENGWVPLTLIANFYRVKAQTTDMDMIMASILPSDEVEVEDGKIRKRTGWEQYLNPGGN